MKKIGIFLASICGIVVVALLVVNYYLGTIIVKGVEKVGPQLTQTSVTLGAVDIQLMKGNVQITNAVIGNPAGYKAPHAFNFKEVLVDVEPKTLLDEVIIINKVLIDSPKLTYVQDAKGSNIQQIVDNINAALAKQKKKKPTGTASPAEDSGKVSKKIILDDFTLRNATVVVSTSMLGVKPLEFILADIHLTGLGRKNMGMTPAEMVSKITTVITAAVNKGALDNFGNFSDITKQLQGSVDGISKDSMKTVEDLKNGKIDPEQAVKSLKGLFN